MNMTVNAQQAILLYALQKTTMGKNNMITWETFGKLIDAFGIYRAAQFVRKARVHMGIRIDKKIELITGKFKTSSTKRR